MNKGLATLYDAEGNILRQDSISENTKAMFTTIDLHAESYYHMSPYSYCGGNPVNAIFFVEGMKLRCFFIHIWGYNTTENKKRNLLVINDCKILC